MKELRDFRAINVRRCITVWRKLEDWGADQWALRMVAEAAELCNAVTQYMEGRKRLEDVMSEYADVYAYLDLLAARLYVSPEGAWGHVLSKFNEVSERKGFAERIAFPPVDAPCDASPEFEYRLVRLNKEHLESAEEFSSLNNGVAAERIRARDKDVALTVLKHVQLALLNANLPAVPLLIASQAIERIQMLVESGEWKP